LATKPNILGSGCAAIPKDIGSGIFIFFFDLNLFFIQSRENKLRALFLILYKN